MIPLFVHAHIWPPSTGVLVDLLVKFVVDLTEYISLALVFHVHVPLILYPSYAETPVSRKLSEFFLFTKYYIIPCSS